MADLSVNIGELQMNNPVMTASGTFGYGEEFADFIELSRIGGIIVKGTTLHKREGNLSPHQGHSDQHDCECFGFCHRRLCRNSRNH
mgnify:CR=1 FL=1